MWGCLPVPCLPRQKLPLLSDPSTVLVNGTPLKSCMKIQTLEESLRSRENEKTNITTSKSCHRQQCISSLSLSNLVVPATQSSKISSSSSSHFTKEHSTNHNSSSSRLLFSPKTKIQFSTLEFRNYHYAVGDNPSVTHGPPLSLRWNFVHSSSEPTLFSIDEYEHIRSPRKHCYEMKLTWEEREERLRMAGVTTKELRRATIDANIARLEREKTLREVALNWGNHGEGFLEEVKEGVVGSLRRLMFWVR